MALAAACSELDSPLATLPGQPGFATVTEIASNATCKTLLRNSTAYEIKLHSGGLIEGRTYGPVTIAAVDSAQTSFDFTSTAPVLGVFVFGGSGSGNFYDARLPKLPVSLAGTHGGDSLRTPGGQQISHVSFCWNGLPEVGTQQLLVSATAAGVYARGIEHDPAGHDSSSDIPASYQVTGTITIRNPTAAKVTFSVATYLDDGTSGTRARISCPTYILPPGTAAAPTQVLCDYSAAPTSASATISNAVVGVAGASPSTVTVTGTTVMMDVSWRVNSGGK